LNHNKQTGLAPTNLFTMEKMIIKSYPEAVAAKAKLKAAGYKFEKDNINNPLVELRQKAPRGGYSTVFSRGPLDKVELRYYKDSYGTFLKSAYMPKV